MYHRILESHHCVFVCEQAATDTPVVHIKQTMSTKPETVLFSYLDFSPAVSAAMAHKFLKEAFQTGYDDCCTEMLAKSFIDRINMIQGDMMSGNLDYYEIWSIFVSDMQIEEFNCNPPGFTMMMSLPLLKKQLFKKLYPHNVYAGSKDEHALDHIDAIIDHMNERIHERKLNMR
jgi:hypothetical protein